MSDPRDDDFKPDPNRKIDPVKAIVYSIIAILLFGAWWTIIDLAVKAVIK